MNWTQLLETRRAQRHETSRQEIDGLRSVVIRDFDDAALADLSADRRFAIYFDTCRRKRNIVDYDCAETVTDTEATELIDKAAEFEEQVEAWITMQHPGLAR
ncbi:MAG: hypothetical protein Q7W29_00465 [bacterium]|nr:hypothetical protein [bacterium]